MKREIELLIDHRDALQARVVRAGRSVRAAADFHHPFIGLVRTAEHLHQRALARAVFADEGVNFAGGDLQRHAAQRAGGAEAFLDSGQPQGCGGGGHYFRYLSNGGCTMSAISGELKLALVTKPTPVSTTGASFSPRSSATIDFTPR